MDSPCFTPQLSENVLPLPQHTAFDIASVTAALQQWPTEASANLSEKLIRKAESKVEKETKRKSIQQTRDSVQEWLKHVQVGLLPQDMAMSSSRTFITEHPNPESEDEMWGKGKERADTRGRERRGSDRKSIAIDKVTPHHRSSYFDVENLVFDSPPQAHASPSPIALAHSALHSPRTSKRDILNALVGVMKRVDDLESQLDLKTKSTKILMKPTFMSKTGESGSTRIDGHRTTSFIQDSKETLFRFEEHLASSRPNHSDFPGAFDQDEESGKMNDSSNAKPDIEPTCPAFPEELKPENREVSSSPKSQEQASLSPQNRNPESIPEERSIQKWRSLAEEIRSAERAELNESCTVNKESAEEDEGVLVLAEEKEADLGVDEHDFDVVSVDEDLDGTFEVVEFDDMIKVAGKGNSKERSSWW